MPWPVYAALSARAQLHCRFMPLPPGPPPQPAAAAGGGGEDEDEGGGYWFERQLAAKQPFRQTVAKL